MKKIIACLLMIISFSVVFAACGKNDGKYWEAAYTEMQTVLETANYTNVENQQYSQNLCTIMESSYGSDFAEITNTQIRALFGATTQA